jgi:hypothetical protein
MANEQKRGDWNDDTWEETVPLDQVDYTRIFITRRTGTQSIRQSAVTLREVIDGLPADDLRLRDEIVRFVGERA